MTCIHNISRCLSLWTTLILLMGIMLLGFTPSALAAREERRDERAVAGPSQRESREVRRDERAVSGQRDLGFTPSGQAAREERTIAGQREFRDDRYNHDRFYPARGQVIRELPRDNRVVVHGGSRYYFHGGVWYRPQGPRFVIVAPPIGLFLPFLPPYYATVWLGGRPYYYANDIYYANRGDGYVVVEPPKGDVSQAPPPADQLFIYPRQNQSEQQQATDRYECHRWAVSQTGFDPTQLPGPGGVPEDQRGQKRADYQRAMSACLDGRGYTVK
jgi:hypothetical protein